MPKCCFRIEHEAAPPESRSGSLAGYATRGLPEGTPFVVAAQLQFVSLEASTVVPRANCAGRVFDGLHLYCSEDRWQDGLMKRTNVSGSSGTTEGVSAESCAGEARIVLGRGELRSWKRARVGT